MTIGRDCDLSDMSMLDLFHMEAENQCGRLAEDLLALEQDPAASRLLESLMRAAHSVKGAARVVELKPAVEIAHAMEDVFVAAQKSGTTLDRDAINMLLQGVDMLRSISCLPEDSIKNIPAAMADEIKSLVCMFGALTTGEKNGYGTVAGTPAASPAITQRQPQAPVDGIPQLPVDLSDMTMLDLFRMEAETHCLKLSENLTALENGPAAPEEILRSMMHASHSMKDAAAIVELDAAVTLARSLEEVFASALQGRKTIGTDDIHMLRHGVALLTTITRIPETEADHGPGVHRPALAELVAQLALLVEDEATANPLPAKCKSPLTVSPAPDIAGFPSSPVKSESRYRPAAKPSRPAGDKDATRVVRVSARNMDRMLGLAGESMIESRRLPAFYNELMRLKYRQDELYQYLDKIRENLRTGKNVDLALNHLADLQKKQEECRRMLARNMEVMESHARHATTISQRLYDEIITSRMRPFSEGISGFTRMVRDIARELGKEVHFVVIGAETKVDRDILDKIEAPLTHMIRNALDHGIEPPAERIAGGKPAKGTIRLTARHSAGMLSITIRDDGRGIDLEKLRRIVVEKNLCTQVSAAGLSQPDLLEFLFLPNLSTKSMVSDISGRGVGMDVVHSVMHEVRGKIRTHTEAGDGTSFELLLPLTLSVIRALITEMDGELYGFPLASIGHVLRLTPDQVQETANRHYFTHNDKKVGLVAAQQVFRTGYTRTAGEHRLHVIVFSDRLGTYGLKVDKLVGVRDLVVQHLDPRLGQVKNIDSAAILEDGAPVLIVDVEEVIYSLARLAGGNGFTPTGRMEKEAPKVVKRDLLADDSKYGP